MKIPLPTSTIKASSSVFVYGSLMSPQVVEVLLGKIPEAQSPVRLHGYTRHPVKEQVFPAIIPAISAKTTGSPCDKSNNNYVDGMIWQGLTDWEMKAFDRFEDVDYQRKKVQVELPTTSNMHDQDDSKTGRISPTTLQIDAYIWANPLSELHLEQEWSFDKFCQDYLSSYLTNTVEPCRIEMIIEET